MRSSSDSTSAPLHLPWRTDLFTARFDVIQRRRTGASDVLAARRAALRVLLAAQPGELRFDTAFQREMRRQPLESLDRALALQLASGALKLRRRLDFMLEQFVAGRNHPLPTPIVEILRLGAYQLTELSRVPRFAAVSTAVELAKHDRAHISKPRRALRPEAILLGEELPRDEGAVPEKGVPIGAAEPDLRCVGDARHRRGAKNACVGEGLSHHVRVASRTVPVPVVCRGEPETEDRTASG